MLMRPSDARLDKLVRDTQTSPTGSDIDAPDIAIVLRFWRSVMVYPGHADECFASQSNVDDALRWVCGRPHALPPMLDRQDKIALVIRAERFRMVLERFQPKVTKGSGITFLCGTNGDRAER